MALNSVQVTSTRPLASFLTLPVEIRQIIYEHHFAPDLSTAQYSDEDSKYSFGYGMHIGCRLGLLAVCKRIHAEAIGVLYACSVFHFRTFVSDIADVVYVDAHISEDGVYRMTVEEPRRADNTFVPLIVDHPPLFCYRPRSHIHMIRNIHLLHSMENGTYSFAVQEDPRREEKFSGLDTAIALYLTILDENCPHLETLTIEFAWDPDVRSCHYHRFPRTIPYLRDSTIIHENTITILERLLPQLRQIRIVTVGANRHTYKDRFGLIKSLQEMVSGRGAVREVVEAKEWTLDVPTVDIRTLTQTQQEDQDYSQA